MCVVEVLFHFPFFPRFCFFKELPSFLLGFRNPKNFLLVKFSPRGKCFSPHCRGERDEEEEMTTTTKRRDNTKGMLAILCLVLYCSFVSALFDDDAREEEEGSSSHFPPGEEPRGMDARDLANKILSGGKTTAPFPQLSDDSNESDDKDEFDAHRDAFAYLETPKSFDESARDESVDIRRHEAILDHILKVEEAEEKMTEEKRKEDDDERDLLPSSSAFSSRRRNDGELRSNAREQHRLDSRFEDWLRKFPERASAYCGGKDDETEEAFAADAPSSSSEKFRLCPQSFARERIYLENLRRVERHNEAVERGWPTETKLELSVDNQFADLTKSEYERLMSENGMRKSEEVTTLKNQLPFWRDKKNAEEEEEMEEDFEDSSEKNNVVATKEMKKLTAGSYAIASLGQSSEEKIKDNQSGSSSSSSSSKKGIFGKVVEEVDDEKDQSGPTLEELKQAIIDDANENETIESAVREVGGGSIETTKKTENILSRQFPEKEREAVNARVIIPKKMQNAAGVKKFSLSDIEDATLDPEFVKYAFKYDKRSEYCGDDDDSQWPCEVAFRKQDVFLANVKEIDEQNRLAKKRGSHMRKGITRFADLTQDEFEDTHATYVPKEHQEDKAEREHRKASKAKKDKIAAEASAKGGSRKFGKHNHHGLFANKEAVVSVENEKDVSVVANKKGEDKTTTTTTDSVTKEEFASKEDEDEEDQRPKKEAGEEEEMEEEGENVTSSSSETSSSSSSSFKKKASNAMSSNKNKKTVVVVQEEEEVSEAEVGEKEERDEEKKTSTRKHLSKEQRKEQEERAKKMTPDEIKKARKANKLKNAKQGIARELPQLGEITKDENLKKKVVDKFNFQNEKNESSDEEAEDDEASNNVIDVQIHEFNDPTANTTTFKKHFDWRNKIDIGPVYSQGACSGCWAYSTVQVIADSKAINTGTRPDLSPYHLLSCDTLDSGCHTGNMATAYAWIGVQRDGILRSRDFSTDITSAEECPLPSNLGSNGEVLPEAQAPKPKGIGIDGYCEIAPLEGKDTILALMRAVKQQPIAVGLNVKPLQLYGGGLVQVADCPPASTDSVTAINHAAVIVGWGMDEAAKKPYWLIKNSYGVDWGEDGYARIAMELTEGGAYGACGLYSEQNYPLTDGTSCAEGSDKRWSEIQGSEGDVYLMPDYVLVLPNGGGLLTPAKFTVFGHDVTNLLKYTSVFCFVSCIALILMEIAQCIHPEMENWGTTATSNSNTPSSGGERTPLDGKSTVEEAQKETLLAKNDDEKTKSHTLARGKKNTTYGTSENA